MELNLDALIGFGPFLLKGLLVTVEMCGLSIAGGLAIGLIIAVVGRSQSRLIQSAVAGYVAILRGTPLLIQLFILYYGGPAFNIVLSAFVAGIIGLSFYSGAYFSEIIRAGFRSIPRGQVESAQVLGFSRIRILYNIELPQMMALIVPSLTTQIIGLVKDSAVLSIITVPELTFVTTRIVTSTFTVVEPYLMLAGLYWALTALISRAGKLIEYSTTGYMH